MTWTHAALSVLLLGLVTGAADARRRVAPAPALAAAALLPIRAEPLPVQELEALVNALTIPQLVQEIVVSTVSARHPYCGTGILYAEHFSRSARQRGWAFSTVQRTKLPSAVGRTREVVIEPILAVDQEGGAIDRFRRCGFPPLPCARELAATRTPAQLADIGERVARQCRSLGVHMLLGPVLDVTVGPGARLRLEGWQSGIQARGYPFRETDRRLAATPARVVLLARSLLDGLRRGREETGAGAGPLLIGKHFPGESAPYNSDHVEVTEELPAGELAARTRVYSQLAGSLEGVMLSNSIFTDGPVTGSVGPACLTTAAVRLAPPGLLTMTDDLALPRRMQRGDQPKDLARAAFDAGCTLLMVCSADRRPAVERSLCERAQSDPQMLEELRRRVLRLLTIKTRLGLIRVTEHE